MRAMLRFGWVGLVGVMALAPLLGAQDAAKAPAAPREVERARAAAAALTTDLRARLMEEMKAGGPAAAVKVCSEVAPSYAAKHSVDGLTVRRVSERWRNPADAPDVYETGKLRELAAGHAKGALPLESWEWVGEGAARRLRYLKPITIGGPCLACHGDAAAIKPEVAALLRERYPEDRATGYRDGDLRGAVSVVVSVAAR
jgi:hypothetical protein